MSPTETRMSAEERRTDVLEAAVPEFAQRGLARHVHGGHRRAAPGSASPTCFASSPARRHSSSSWSSAFSTWSATTFIEAAEGLTGEAALDSMGWSYGAFLGNRDELLMQMHAMQGVR